MYKILTLNNISKVGLNLLPKDKYQISNSLSELENPDAILLRSFSMHDMEVPKSVKAVARAGAGVNNIPIEKFSDKGIVVFNTPGANANAVKELVVAGLLLSSRKILPGVEWVQSLKGQEDVEQTIERGKSQFQGPELYGKTIGVIGLGAIGVKVANICKSLGMDVLGYDPFMSVDAAWSLSRSVKKAFTMEEVISESDYITLHMPLNNETKGMFNEELFMKVKPGARLLNFSRGELMDYDGLKKALESGIISVYITDFPDEKILELKHVIPMPHIGASTPESEDNCAEMAANQLKVFLETGNITNSVNLPSCNMPLVDRQRITVVHRNVPKVVSGITTAVGSEGTNIDNMINKSKGNYAYTMVSVDGDVKKESVEAIRSLDGVISVRVIK